MSPRKDNEVLILGAGCSGRAAAGLLCAEGTPVRILDETEHGLEELAGVLRDSSVCRRVVVSPGFAPDHPWMRAVVDAGAEILSELELGWMRRRSRVIAVTGSNGKSTVVKWIADALETDGQTAIPCGNYGLPVCDAVRIDPPPDWLVVEVSSFQLETVCHFRPEIALLLNILPNHLDRHGTMEAYRDLKYRLFARQREGDLAVLPHSEAECLPVVPGVQRCTFGTEPDANICYTTGRAGAVDLRGTRFDNPVLGPAAAAVVAVCGGCGVSMEALECSARTFIPLPYRMQDLGEIDGVRYVNDSKSTNLAALCAAVESVSGPVHLIAGGRAKERDFSSAKDLLAGRGVVVYLIGEASSDMQKVWENAVRCIPCDTVERAVEAAHEQAVRGETILFSPGCTSFDRFGGFEERGRCFADAVGTMQKG